MKIQMDNTDTVHDDGTTHLMHLVRTNSPESMATFRSYLEGYLCGMGLYFQRVRVESDPTELDAPEGEYFLVRVSP